MKFDNLEPRCCEDIKGIVAPEIGPKSFGTFERQASTEWRLRRGVFSGVHFLRMSLHRMQIPVQENTSKVYGKFPHY